MNTVQILKKASQGRGLSDKEAIFLLVSSSKNKNLGREIAAAADRLTRNRFGCTGEIHAQIGINLETCTNNCAFCFFAERWNRTGKRVVLTVDEVVQKAESYVTEGVSSITLMCTAFFGFDDFLVYGQAVRQALDPQISLAANCGDISYSQACELVRAGFTAYYHACRLREGSDTEIQPAQRLLSLKNAKKAGLILSSCIEPAGPEHSAVEYVEIMRMCRNLNVPNMAVMRRVNVPGSPLEVFGELDDDSFAVLTAVTRLYFGSRIFSFITHEPNIVCLNAGANMLISESGPNPRDDMPETSFGRGCSVETCKNLLSDAGLIPFSGSVEERYKAIIRRNRSFMLSAGLLYRNFRYKRILKT